MSHRSGGTANRPLKNGHVGIDRLWVTLAAMLAAAIAALWLALPRHGQVRGFVGNDLIEFAIAFLITASGGVGLILVFGGLVSL